MNIHDVWMIHYKDDNTFKMRLSLVQDIMKKEEICDAEYCRQLCIEFKIPCGINDTIMPDRNRAVESVYKIPFL